MVYQIDLREYVSPDKKIVIYSPEKWGGHFPEIYFPKELYSCVKWFKDFESFEKAVEMEAFDVVLMCIWKEYGTRGFYDAKLVRPIRKRLPKAKIIAVSATTTTEQIKDAILSGADYFLDLPFDLYGLFDAFKDYEWQKPYVHRKFKLARCLEQYLGKFRELRSKE